MLSGGLGKQAFTPGKATEVLLGEDGLTVSVTGRAGLYFLWGCCSSQSFGEAIKTTDSLPEAEYIESLNKAKAHWQVKVMAEK